MRIPEPKKRTKVSRYMRLDFGRHEGATARKCVGSEIPATRSPRHRNGKRKAVNSVQYRDYSRVAASLAMFSAVKPNNDWVFDDRLRGTEDINSKTPASVPTDLCPAHRTAASTERTGTPVGLLSSCAVLLQNNSTHGMDTTVHINIFARQ